MFELWLTTDTGIRLSQLDYTLGFSASRIANGIGFFEGEFEVDFNPAFIKPDFMVQVWVHKALWRAYFIRKWRFYTEDNVEYLRIGGPDHNDLLRRRIVAAYTGEAAASKEDLADSMLVEVVTESMYDVLSPTPDAGTRAWANLRVVASPELGPLIEKAFAWRKLLTLAGSGILPDICASSVEAGVPLFFDIVPDVVTGTSISLVFVTHINQPGLDASDRVTFSRELGNLKDPYYEEDWTQEKNYVYAGGQGTESGRTVEQVYDSTRFGVSQWARCEGFADARDQEDAGVENRGRDVLQAGRPKRRFGGIPLDTEGTRFGRDWDFGFRVSAEYHGVIYTPQILGIVIGVDSAGKPFINTRMDWDE